MLTTCTQPHAGRDYINNIYSAYHTGVYFSFAGIQPGYTMLLGNLRTLLILVPGINRVNMQMLLFA